MKEAHIISQVNTQVNSRIMHQRIAQKGRQMSMVDREAATARQDLDTATCLLDHNGLATSKAKNCQSEVQVLPQANVILHNIPVLVIEYSRLIALVQMIAFHGLSILAHRERPIITTVRLKNHSGRSQRNGSRENISWNGRKRSEKQKTEATSHVIVHIQTNQSRAKTNNLQEILAESCLTRGTAKDMQLSATSMRAPESDMLERKIEDNHCNNTIKRVKDCSPNMRTNDCLSSSSNIAQTTTRDHSRIMASQLVKPTPTLSRQHRQIPLHRQLQFIASPSGSLQNASPSIASVITVQSPVVAVSPIISTRSPVMLTHRSPAPNIHTPSPRTHPPPHRTSSTTPPPPPPPIFPQISTAQAAPQTRFTDNSPKNPVRVDSSSKQQDSTAFNGLHNFSQSQLHPLQQATLLQQAQFQGGAIVGPTASGTTSSRSPSSSQFQPIKQSNSTPSSPQSFPPRTHSSQAPAVQRTSVAATKQLALHPPQQSVNLVDYGNQFSRELVAHTLGWPADTVEKQAQRSAEDTTNLCLVNSRLKADLIPLNFHQNLTRMRMGVGIKRIEFLRAQTRKLESSDAVS